VEMARPPARNLSDRAATDAILQALTRPHARHVLVDERKVGEAVRQGVVFRTSRITQSLLVLAIAGMDEPAPGGARSEAPIDFDDLSVRELPLRSVLPTDLAPPPPAPID